MSSTAAAERKGVAMATAVIARTTRSDRTSMMRLHQTARLDCGLQGLVILAKHGQTRHTNIGEVRRPEGSRPCVAVGAKRFWASPRPSTREPPPREVTGRPFP